MGDTTDFLYKPIQYTTKAGVTDIDSGMWCWSSAEFAGLGSGGGVG